MAVDADFVRDIAPELSNENEQRIARFIALAENCVDATVWSKHADHATALLVAHMISLSNTGTGSAGAVTREKVGDLEIGYEAPSGSSSDHELATTKYGLEFLRLRRKLVITPRVVGCLSQ